MAPPPRPDYDNPQMSPGVRYAPSPTGRLHIGNLRTAWISREWARALGLPWVVRYEDIDSERASRSWVDVQRGELEALGLHADREFIQTDRMSRHLIWWKTAVGQDQIYPCFCSRKDVQQALAGLQSAPHLTQGLDTTHSPKPPTCPKGCDRLDFQQRQLKLAETTDRFRNHRTPNGYGWRFRAPDGADFLIGRTKFDGNSEFESAYVWACAIDDIEGDAPTSVSASGLTDEPGLQPGGALTTLAIHLAEPPTIVPHPLLVRAWDLESSVVPQRQIQTWICGQLGQTALTLPAVFHTSLVVDRSGHRLEKRTHGVTWEELSPRMSQSDLVERFRRTFDDSVFSGFLSGGVWGEVSKTLSLGEILD